MTGIYYIRLLEYTDVSRRSPVREEAGVKGQFFAIVGAAIPARACGRPRWRRAFLSPDPHNAASAKSDSSPSSDLFGSARTGCRALDRVPLPSPRLWAPFTVEPGTLTKPSETPLLAGLHCATFGGYSFNLPRYCQATMDGAIDDLIRESPDGSRWLPTKVAERVLHENSSSKVYGRL